MYGAFVVIAHHWSAAGSSSTMPLQSLSFPSHVSTPPFVISHVQTFPEAPCGCEQSQLVGQSAGDVQFCEQLATRLQSLHAASVQHPTTPTPAPASGANVMHCDPARQP